MNEGRTERNHIPVRIFCAEDTAFETSVDDHHLRFFAELLVVDLLHGGEDRAVDVWFPAVV